MAASSPSSPFDNAGKSVGSRYVQLNVAKRLRVDTAQFPSTPGPSDPNLRNRRGQVDCFPSIYVNFRQFNTW